MTDLNNQNVGNKMYNVQNNVFSNPKGSQSDSVPTEKLSEKEVDLDSLNRNPAATCGRSMLMGVNKKPDMSEAAIKKHIKTSLYDFAKFPKAVEICMLVYELMLEKGYSEEHASRASDLLFKDLTFNV